MSITIDDVRLKFNLKLNQTLIFTEKSFFYILLVFTRSHSYPFDDTDGFYQLVAGTYKSDKPNNITGIDKVLLKCDCFNGSTVNSARKPIFYSFALSSQPGHKMYEEPRIKVFKKINKSVLAHIRFYLEDDDHKIIDFKAETISFT